MWNVIQKSKEKNQNIISSNLTQLQINTRETSRISSHGNQGEKEEARLRDFRILMAENLNELFVNVIPKLGQMG